MGKFLEPVVQWMFDSTLPDKPTLNKHKLEICFFSFWRVHHYFEIMAGLNYRVIRNLHVCVCFKHIKLVKRLLGSFHYTHFFLRILFIWPILIFQTNFTFFWIFLSLLVSINIHVIKIITWNLADVWYFIFSTDPTDISSCVGIGTGYKSIVKSKFCAQPMHQIFII